MAEVRRNARGAVILDDRYAPLIITTFLGDANLELGQWFMEANRRVLVSQAALGRRVISIVDATHARKPTPEMRKFWADMSNGDGDSVRNASLANFIVVNNSLIRGAITAIAWLSPTLRALESFATMEEALDQALLRLSKAGIAAPKLRTPYALPDGGQKARAAFGA